eukprot:g2144.t1
MDHGSVPSPAVAARAATKMRTGRMEGWVRIVETVIVSVRRAMRKKKATESRRWREVLALQDGMVAEGIMPGGNSFNALIEACSKGGQVNYTDLTAWQKEELDELVTRHQARLDEQA